MCVYNSYARHRTRCLAPSESEPYHYENLAMQYTEIFSVVKIENFVGKIFNYFLFLQNIDCGYTLEPPRRGGSNEYPQSMFWSKNKKNQFTPAYPCCGDRRDTEIVGYPLTLSATYTGNRAQPVRCPRGVPTICGLPTIAVRFSCPQIIIKKIVR